MTEQTEDEKKLEYLKLRISLLFSNYIDHEPSEDIECIGQYFSYLSENINHKLGLITSDRELILQFEAVCLLLKDRLTIYPESVKKQVTGILDGGELTKLFGALGTLDEKDFQRMVRNTELVDEKLNLGYFFGQIYYLFITLLFPVDREFGINRGQLLQAKILLNRLAQILHFTSTIELFDYEGSDSKLKDHYDPNLIQKEKIIALIALLRVQLKIIPDQSIQDKVTERLDSLAGC